MRCLRTKRNGLASILARFCRRNLATSGRPMPPPSRRPIPRPALWIAVPTFVVSLAVVASLQAGIVAALIVALLGAIAVGIFAERRLARIISSFDRIARGDRYTSLPTLLGDGDRKSVV